MLETLTYPLDFKFKVLSLSPQFTVTDAEGQQVAHIKQKLFKLRERVSVYHDDTKARLRYEVSADRWLDFSASYAITDTEGQKLGRVARRGVRSLWKAHYDIFDAADRERYTIREQSVVTRMLDNMLGEVPVLGLLTGFFFHPTYEIQTSDGTVVALFEKKASAIGRRFRLEKVGEIDPEGETQIVLSLLMMVLLERDRG